MSHVFVIVTSKTCTHCITFKKQHLQPLLTNLSDVEGLNIINISFPSRTTDVLDKNTKIFTGTPNNEIENYSSSKPVVFYYKGGNIGVNLKITKQITGFPQFFLFTKEEWQANGELNGIIFNGVKNDGSMEKAKEFLPPNAENLSKWIKNGISNKISTNSTNNINRNLSGLPGYVAPTAGRRIKIKSDNDE